MNWTSDIFHHEEHEDHEERREHGTGLVRDVLFFVPSVSFVVKLILGCGYGPASAFSDGLIHRAHLGLCVFAPLREPHASHTQPRSLQASATRATDTR